MADLDDIKDGKDWGRDRPADTSRFYPKGAEHHDGGMKARLARVFNQASGKTVMLAFMLGYPVPIVIFGGKKLPERDALDMAWRAVNQDASGFDMGSNVFQSSDPTAMLQALQAVVYRGERPDQAYALFKDFERKRAA